MLDVISVIAGALVCFLVACLCVIVACFTVFVVVGTVAFVREHFMGGAS